jgi:hypothetical protein
MSARPQWNLPDDALEAWRVVQLCCMHTIPNDLTMKRDRTASANVSGPFGVQDS